MKPTKFLIKLKKEGKLQITEPSEEVAESYLNKSDSNLESAKILLASNKLEESVSLAYYAMYNCLLAMLFKCGIKCENHSVSILLLKDLFKENDLAKDISFGKKERIDKQYYTNFKITKQECEAMSKKTEDFVVECKTIIKQLHEEKISKLRQELDEVLE
tara:strand:- start:37 stop:516 length:480 start_codon:yes stop_codon:yes gene_type:complete